MKFPLIIGIAGPARAGKDTLCFYLRMAIRGPFTERYAFADPMKAGLIHAFGLTEDHVNGDLKEVPVPELAGRSTRQVMQWFGTDFARAMIDEEIWLRVAETHCRKLQREQSAEIVIIPDVRFDNEAAWVRENGLLFHIRRHGEPQVAEHVSESGIRPLEDELIIQNKGDLLALEDEAAILAEHIKTFLITGVRVWEI